MTSRRVEQPSAGLRRPGFRLTRESSLLIMIGAIIVFGAVGYRDYFPNVENLNGILRNFALDAIMACGMMLLMVSGVFDLSVGAIFSLVSVATASMMKFLGMPVWMAVTAGLVIALLCGLVNGFITAKIKVNALITTLGTQQIFRGLSVWIAGANIANLPPGFNAIGQTKILGLPSYVWIMMVIVAGSAVLLANARFFRQFYYIGGNQKAAKLSGINVDRMQIIGFCIMGLMAGLAGILFAARLGAAVTAAGDGKELAIITATILGGASLSGGKGTIWGALIGVVFIALINNLMIIATVPSYWQSIAIGAILIVAVATDWLMSRSR